MGKADPILLSENKKDTASCLADLYISKSILVDCAIFSFYNGFLEVLLVKNPENDKWGLPSDWLRKNENLDSNAKRVIRELIGYNVNYIGQLKAFENRDQFLSNEIIVIGYFTLIDRQEYYMTFKGRQKGAQWFKAVEAQELIGSYEIIKFSLHRIREKSLNSPLIFNLLPEKFTLPDLIKIYEEVLNHKIEKSNFRKKILNLDILAATNEKQYGTSKRAAFLYRLNFKISNEFKLSKEILGFAGNADKY
jgi:8-oxo-dGTP diphosphatase